MGLPRPDGFRVAAEPRDRHGQARQKAERVGAYAYLHKPFDVGRLVDEVRPRLPPR